MNDEYTTIDVGEFNCYKCGIIFEIKEKIDYHVKTKHFNKYVTCYKIFINIQTLCKYCGLSCNNCGKCCFSRNEFGIYYSEDKNDDTIPLSQAVNFEVCSVK